MFQGFLFFWKYCWREQKSYALLLMAVEVVGAFLFLAGLIFPKYILDSLFVYQLPRQAVFLIGLFLGITLFSNVMQALLRFYAERSRDQMYRKFSLTYARAILHTDYANLEKPEYMDLKENALRCMSGVYGFAGAVLLAVNLFGKILTLGSVIVIVMTLHQLLLVLLIGIIIGNTQVSKYINEKNEMMDMEKAPLQRKENYYFSLGDNFSFAKEIRLDGLTNWVLRLYREQFGKVYEITKKKNSNSCREMTFGKLCVFLEQFLAYGYLFYMVLYRELSAGSFTMYLTAILSFNAVVTETLQIIGKLQQSTVYMEQFKAFMTYPCEEKNNQEHYNFKNSSVENAAPFTICFEDVSFRYPGQEAYALRHVSCEIKSGEKIAIVGENGAGKTTFIKLLLRLYRPEEGRILFNGKDINTMEYEQYLELFSVVFQDYKLFAMTIRENIALKNEAFSDLELEQIAQLLGLSEKLEKLPDGLHAPVYKTFDENGFEPSGGEAQKIAMARAFARKAPIVILDEPVAALDPMAEYEIYCKFSKLVQEKTAIFISHRLASCRVCDRIFVFLNPEQARKVSNGSFTAKQAAALEPDFYSSIAECGTHEELLSAGGYYAEVYRMQAAWYEEVQANV